MKALAITERTKNVEKHDYCKWCGNTGYVQVTADDPHDDEWRAKVKRMSLRDRLKTGLHRAVYEAAMGPCPYCERGYFNEFGHKDKQHKSPPVEPEWSLDDGFWAGRTEANIVPHTTSSELLPRDENLRRLRELRAHLDTIPPIAKDMPK